jgi:hypothetical protein
MTKDNYDMIYESRRMTKQREELSNFIAMIHDEKDSN